MYLIRHLFCTVCKILGKKVQTGFPKKKKEKGKERRKQRKKERNKKNK